METAAAHLRAQPGPDAAAPPGEPTGRSARFLAGDPLRAVAALLVVTFHVAMSVTDGRGGLWGPHSYGPVFDRLVMTLPVGLYVFFVLSGYLLARPFVAALADRRPLPPLGPYLSNRLLRIVPAFYVVAAVTVLHAGTAGGSREQVLAVFAFAQTWLRGPIDDHIAQAWTLDVEMVFYLLLPLGAWLCARVAAHRLGRAGRLRLVLGLAGAVLAASLALRFAGLDAAGYYQRFPVALWAFAPGIALAVADTALAGRRLRGRWWRAAPALLVVAGLAAWLGLYRNTDLALTAPLLQATLSGALVAAALVRQWIDGRSWRLLDNAPMRWLGERSYCIYLVHVGIMWEISGSVYTVGGSWAALALGLPVTLALSVLAADLLHRTVERPCMRLRGRRARRRRAAGSPGPAPATA